MDSLRQSIERLLRKHGRGYAFTRKDLRDLASTGTLGRVLARMAQDGTIRRLVPAAADVAPDEGSDLSQTYPTDFAILQHGGPWPTTAPSVHSREVIRICRLTKPLFSVII